jgi:hypothetical protein
MRSSSLSPAPPTKLVNQLEFDFTLDEDSDDEGDGPKMNYYESPKILGTLYRNVDEHRIWREDVDVRPAGPERDRETLGRVVWDQLLKAAGAEIARYPPGTVQFETKMKMAWKLRNL